MEKLLLAVNYGGPTLGRETEYLKNLFSDPIVFPLPFPLRFLFSRLMALWRKRESRQILEEMGGESPLLTQTERQIKVLKELLPEGWETDLAMLYSKPLLKEVLKEASQKGFKEIVILPLFPQYSSATWKSVEFVVSKSPPKGKVRFVRPFYDCEKFLLGWEKAIREVLEGLKEPFLLFSAHSLPLYLVRRYDDPYPEQVEKTASLLAQKFSLPYAVGYQSKLGPIKWLEPSTEELIKKLAKEGVEELVVVPISFVSENSETLWEIDLNYRYLAKSSGIKTFRRVPIPYLSEDWLHCWRDLVLEATK